MKNAIVGNVKGESEVEKELSSLMSMVQGLGDRVLNLQAKLTPVLTNDLPANPVGTDCAYPESSIGNRIRQERDNLRNSRDILDNMLERLAI